MSSFRTGRVTEILAKRPGLQKLEVDVDGARRSAYVLTRLVGDCAVGDEVVVNVTAVELGLGTGGWDVVHWNLDRRSLDVDGGGHVMKLRYTSLQADTGVEEERDGYLEPGDLGGTPIVVCTLHSQIAPVAAAYKSVRPRGRVVYVMTDSAALPLVISDLAYDLEQAGLIDVTITAGHAFGGDYEAVNVRSALGVARRRGGADVVVVAPGPGGVGTATQYGYSAFEVAANLETAARAGGRAIVAARASTADPRERHQGVSHHTLTALDNVRADVNVALPTGATWPVPSRYLVEVDGPDVAPLLAAAGIAVTTMGREPAEDPEFFRFAAAAGFLAARF